MLTNPSPPELESYSGRSNAAAARRSSMASSSYNARLEENLGDRPRVLGIRRDRIAEDRRVGGEARDTIVPDEAREGSVAQHAATDVIEPCALSELAQLEQRIGYRRAHTVTLRRE